MEVPQEALSPAAQNARLATQDWGRRLSDAGDERRMDAWLREAERAGNSTGSDAREKALLQVTHLLTHHLDTLLSMSTDPAT